MKKKIIFLIFVFLRISNSYSNEITSFQELSFSKIQKQKGEFDCGISVVQSILINLFDIEVSQKEISSLIYLSSSEKENGGISFLDMKKIFLFFSIETEGFKIENKNNFLNNLTDINLPIICHLQDEEKLKNGHFVILYKVTKNNVFILDPKLGERIYKYEYFEKKWSGNFLSLVTNFDNNYPSQQSEHKMFLLDYYYNEY